MTFPRLAVLTLATVITFAAAPAGAQAPVGAALSAANLSRLRALTMGAGVADPFPANLAQLFGLGAEAIPAKQLMSNWRGGEIYLVFLDSPRTEVVMTVKDATRIAIYLTDATRELRAAAVVDASGTRRVTVEQAAAAFSETLKRWNELAIAQATAAP